MGEGFWEGFLEGVLRRGFREGTQKAEVRLFESTTPLACALYLFCSSEFFPLRIVEKSGQLQNLCYIAFKAQPHNSAWTLLGANRTRRCDRCCDSRPSPWPRPNSQPQWATDQARERRINITSGQTEVFFSLFYSGSPRCPLGQAGVERRQKKFMRWSFMPVIF